MNPRQILHFILPGVLLSACFSIKTAGENTTPKSEVSLEKLVSPLGTVVGGKELFDFPGISQSELKNNWGIEDRDRSTLFAFEIEQDNQTWKFIQKLDNQEIYTSPQKSIPTNPEKSVPAVGGWKFAIRWDGDQAYIREVLSGGDAVVLGDDVATFFQAPLKAGDVVKVKLGEGSYQFIVLGKESMFGLGGWGKSQDVVKIEIVTSLPQDTAGIPTTTQAWFAPGWGLCHAEARYAINQYTAINWYQYKDGAWLSPDGRSLDKRTPKVIVADVDEAPLTQDERAEGYMKTAGSLLWNHNQKKAVKQIESALAIKSSDDILGFASMIYIEAEEWEKAIEVCTKGIELEESTREEGFRMCKAWSNLILGRWKEAIAEAKELSKISSDSIEPHVIMTFAYLKLGDTKAAQKAAANGLAKTATKPIVLRFYGEGGFYRNSWVRSYSEAASDKTLLLVIDAIARGTPEVVDEITKIVEAKKKELEAREEEERHRIATRNMSEIAVYVTKTIHQYMFLCGAASAAKSIVEISVGFRCGDKYTDYFTHPASSYIK